MKQTRAQWERSHLYNEPFPPWRIATWRERSQKALLTFLLGAAFVGAVAFAGLLASMADHHALQERETRTSCLKQATTGYEIEQCK